MPCLFSLCVIVSFSEFVSTLCTHTPVQRQGPRWLAGRPAGWLCKVSTIGLEFWCYFDATHPHSHPHTHIHTLCSRSVRVHFFLLLSSELFRLSSLCFLMHFVNKRFCFTLSKSNQPHSDYFFFHICSVSPSPLQVRLQTSLFSGGYGQRARTSLTALVVRLPVENNWESFFQWTCQYLSSLFASEILPSSLLLR